MWILLYVALVVLATIYGSKKEMAFHTFFVSLILSPLVGFIYVLVSKAPHKAYKEYLDKAKRELYKENYNQAIDDYKNALYHLENDYKNLWGKGAKDRDNLILTLKEKIKKVESKIIINSESSPHKELS